jgi:hypothetical protein
MEKVCKEEVERVWNERLAVHNNLNTRLEEEDWSRIQRGDMNFFSGLRLGLGKELRNE